MAKLSRHFSDETNDLLRELADENRLSVIKRKGLVDHLLKKHVVGENLEDVNQTYGPRQRPFVKRHKSSLDSIASLRKKDAIVKSGAYERSTIAPPKGKEITEKEKEKLIHHMAYQCAPSELPDLNEILKRRRAKKIDIEITPRSRQAELLREIQERMEFLDEMQSLGPSYVRKYEATIKSEIADKANELDALKRADEPQADEEEEED